MTTRPPLRLALGLAALAFALPLAAAAAESQTSTPEKCAERFSELLKDFPAPDVTAYKLDGHNHVADAKAKDANFRFQGWLFVSRKTAVDALVFKKASAALRAKTTFAADARNCFTPEFGLRLRNGEQELDLLVGVHCQAVEFHAGKVTARYPLSELGTNTFRALFDDLFEEKPGEKKEKKEGDEKEEVEKRFSRKVSFEFQDVPAGEALKMLDSLVGVGIIVDPILRAPIKRKKLALKVTDLPLHEALDQLCAAAGVEWKVRDQTIFIGERLNEEQVEMRIYDVSDFVKTEELDAFREQMMQQVVKDNWNKEKEQTAEVHGDRLVVMQTPTAHALIDRYIARQRAIKYLAMQFHEGQRGEGQPAWIIEAQKKLERNIAYTFTDTSFSDALKYLDILVSINIVTDPRIVDKLATKVTLSAKEEPAYLSYARLLEAAGLIAEYREEGGIGALFISSRKYLAADAAAGNAAKLLDAVKDAPLVACKVEAKEAPNEADTPEAAYLARWKILVARDVLEGKTAEEVRTVLTSAESYTDKGHYCFEPGMGFRLKKGNQRLDIVISLKCRWAYLNFGEQRHHLGLSDKGVEALKALYEKLFPASEEQTGNSVPAGKK